MKSKIMKLIASVLAIAMLAGCGGSGGVQPDASQNGVNAVATDKIVTLGVSGTPELDPAIATSNSGIIAMVNLYDTLIFGNMIFKTMPFTWFQILHA